MRGVVGARASPTRAAAPEELQSTASVYAAAIVASSSSKRSVSDLIGNQHGGKYNFDGSYVEGASAGADYGRRRKATVPADEAWAAVDAAKKEGALTGAFYAEDMFGRPVLLFRNAYTVERLENDADLDLGLQPWALPPATAP